MVYNRGDFCYNQSKPAGPDRRMLGKAVHTLMIDLFRNLTFFAAEATTAAAGGDAAAAGAPYDAGTGVGSMISMVLSMAVLFVVFYFFLIRPQKKKEKKTKEMLDALKKGDRICTIGGIYGTIAGIKDDTITLTVGGDKMTMVIARWAVRSVEDVSVENEGEMLN